MNLGSVWTDGSGIEYRSYYYTTQLSLGDHSYYFYFTDIQGNSARLPLSGSFSGPTVVDGNLDPVADAGGPYQVKVGQTVTFDGGGSFDPDGSIVEYEWHYQNGLHWGKTVQTIYYVPGTWQVKLTVTDDDGATDVDTTTVKVTLL